MNLLVLRCDIYSDCVPLQGFQWEAWGIQPACLTGGTLMPISVSPAAGSFWNISVGLLGVVQDLTQFTIRFWGSHLCLLPFQDFFPPISNHFSPIFSIPLSFWALCSHVLPWSRSVLREKPGSVFSVVLTHLLPFFQGLCSLQFPYTLGSLPVPSEVFFPIEFITFVSLRVKLI